MQYAYLLGTPGTFLGPPHSIAVYVVEITIIVAIG